MTQLPTALWGLAKEKMKNLKGIWVITTGCYSDYCVHSIFADEQKAKTYFEKHAKHYDCAELLFWEFDDKDFENAMKDLPMYVVDFDRYGQIIQAYQVGYSSDISHKENVHIYLGNRGLDAYLSVDIIAKDIEMAKKAAAERRFMYLETHKNEEPVKHYLGIYQ